ncbi:SiaB family protein kinase [Nitrincola sp. MINF-07-Sa-05]|uniref:SiaB family protein kinase n=1 Tax=Nitrincola salilacus TaxID=3400273 RepID=UPI003917D12F
MLASYYQNFKQELDVQGVVLCYSGYVSEKVLYSLGDILRRKMESEDTNQAKRLFSVFVEQVQNIIRYSDERLTSSSPGADAVSSGLVLVGAEEGGYFVVCANVLDVNKVADLKQRLEQLRAMDKDELKAHYREKLRSPSEEESQGGSIGLIEIARRSSKPIEFDFLELQNRTSFFCLKAFI